MNAPVHGFGSLFARLVDREEPAPRAGGVAAELRALEVGVDTASPEAAELGPCLFQHHKGATHAIDRLRLPLPQDSGRDLSAAAARILRADTSTASTSRERVEKEAKMRRVLAAVAGVVDFVNVRAANERKRS
jgi:hypothetical protein